MKGVVLLALCISIVYGQNVPIDYYAGHLVDMSFRWSSTLLDSNSPVTKDAANIYTQRIASTLKQYSGVSVTVAKFNAYGLNTDEGFIKYLMVQFLLTLSSSSSPSGAVISANISTASEQMGYKWQRIKVESLTNTPTTPKPIIGDAPGWKETATLLENSVNFSVDPCTDFYEFTCGGWKKNNPIPPYLPTFDVFTKLSIKIFEEMAAAYDKIDVNDPTESKAVIQSKIFYDSCMKPVKPENDFKLLNDMFLQYNGWPIITKDWKGPVGMGSLSGFMGRLEGTLGVHAMMQLAVMNDWSFPKKQLALVVPSDPTLPPGGSIDNLVKIIMGTTTDFASKLGITVDQTQIQQDAKAIAGVAKKVSDVLYNSDIDENKFPYPYLAFNVTTASARWPYLNWTAYWSAVAQDNLDDPSMVMDMNFVIPWPKYFDNLKTVVESLDDRTKQNYMIWCLMGVESKYLSSLKELRFQLDNLIKPTQEKAPLPIHCTAQLTQTFIYPCGRVYADIWIKQMPANTRDELSGMISKVLGAFKGMLYDLKWIDPMSKVGAYNKIKNLVKNVGYPPWIMDNKQLDARYSEIKLSPQDDSYVTNNKLLRFNTWTTIRLLGKPTDRTSFGQSPAVVNAWYQPLSNSITFPIAILQPPFFNPDFPMSFNYGNTGSTMGHELTHGFDNNGVNWDGNGAYDPWMDSQSQQNFNKMGTCVVEEYGKFCYPSVHECINGKQTEGENIADNGGTVSVEV